MNQRIVAVYNCSSSYLPALGPNEPLHFPDQPRHKCGTRRARQHWKDRMQVGSCACLAVQVALRRPSRQRRCFHMCRVDHGYDRQVSAIVGPLDEDINLSGAQGLAGSFAKIKGTASVIQRRKRIAANASQGRSHRLEVRHNERA